MNNELKSKLLNFLLLLASLIGYLEWGNGNTLFLFQAEVEILTKAFAEPTSVIHPLTILPFVGQVLLFVTFFQKKPSIVLTFLGIAGIGILIVLMFVVGVLSLNYKILLSTIPFLVIGFLSMRHNRQLKIKRKR